jgi:hypothetical protein
MEVMVLLFPPLERTFEFSHRRARVDTATTRSESTCQSVRQRPFTMWTSGLLLAAITAGSMVSMSSDASCCTMQPIVHRPLEHASIVFADARARNVHTAQRARSRGVLVKSRLGHRARAGSIRCAWMTSASGVFGLLAFTRHSAHARIHFSHTGCGLWQRDAPAQVRLAFGDTVHDSAKCHDCMVRRWKCRVRMHKLRSRVCNRVGTADVDAR